MDINGNDLITRGLTPGPTFKLAIEAANALAPQHGRDAALTRIGEIHESPEGAVDDPTVGAYAAALVAERAVPDEPVFVERDEPATYGSWCEDPGDGALEQMANSMRLPSAVRGALMPDAHMGYGLPIGGVLATRGTVIPYAVGVDIACRMKLTVLDVDVRDLKGMRDRFEKVLLRETVFGVGGAIPVKERRDHEVLDEANWDTQLLRGLRERATAQLGSSGSGNHFTSFDVLTIENADNELGLDTGEYIAVLSHSGSRGAGAKIADHFSKLAEASHPELPRELRHLAWLDLGTDDGDAYWHAMSLMGEYASACHETIHARIARALKASVIANVENHHNFAWRETHGGEELIVHRKGATPAGEGVLGIIPGSMATPAFVVSGRGNPDSLASASHGAGRAMSRTAARNKYTWAAIRPMLKAADVTLLAAGIDENPLAYKDIHEVMAQQTDLVKVVARLDPKIVRMADAGEKAED